MKTDDAGRTALAIARDGRGEELTIPDAWLFVIQNGEGPGADALRLAVSGRAEWRIRLALAGRGMPARSSARSYRWSVKNRVR